jgi:hypothetical protein
MTVRWSMRPIRWSRESPTEQAGFWMWHTYDRMMRGSNQRRYFENSGPARSAVMPAARQRPRPDAKNFGGEVSF